MDTESNNSVCAENPYEQKLFSMFCGHDKDQQGWLSIPALQQLCSTLELKENGTKLIAAVTERCKGSNNGETGVRVTFKAFKEELLHVLGTDTQMGAAVASGTPVPSGDEKEDPNGGSEQCFSVVLQGAAVSDALGGGVGGGGCSDCGQEKGDEEGDSLQIQEGKLKDFGWMENVT